MAAKDAAAAVLRLIPSTTALLGGTIVIGAGIAVANVLLPGVIRRDFGSRIGLMTGLYSMTLSIGAALAAGLEGNWAVPLVLLLALLVLQTVTGLGAARERYVAPGRRPSDAR